MRYEHERAFGDAFLPHAKRCLEYHGLTNIDESCHMIDAEQGTDLIGYLGKKCVDVAFRMRDFEKYYGKYKNDFTIRFSLKSGNETEYGKIMKGCADWMLYGFGVRGADKILTYGLVHVDGIRKRLGLIGYENCEKRSRLVPSSGDRLLALRWDELPASCYIGGNIVNPADMWKQEQVDWLDEYIRASA